MFLKGRNQLKLPWIFWWWPTQQKFKINKITRPYRCRTSKALFSSITYIWENTNVWFAKWSGNCSIINLKRSSLTCFEYWMQDLKKDQNDDLSNNFWFRNSSMSSSFSSLIAHVDDGYLIHELVEFNAYLSKSLHTYLYLHFVFKLLCIYRNLYRRLFPVR